MNKYSSMPIPKEAWQEDYIEPGPQGMPPGSTPQAATSGITEDPAPVQVIEAISETPSPSTGEGSHHLGWIHQVIQYNSVKNPTEVNLDAEMLASPSGEEHNVSSQSSRLIQEYVNLRISGLRQRKIIQ